jgi:hypothetical protein
MGGSRAEGTPALMAERQVAFSLDRNVKNVKDKFYIDKTR